MQPAIKTNIPVRVKNSYNPNTPGTVITNSRCVTPGTVRGRCGVGTSGVKPREDRSIESSVMAMKALLQVSESN